jgi:surface antigen
MPILTRIAGIAVLAGGLTARAPAAQRDMGTIGEVNRTTAGTVVGAFGGGLLGAPAGRGSGQLAAIAAGTQDLAYAAPIGQQITGSSLQSGHAAAVTPQRERTDSVGNSCCEYRSTITVGGKTEQPCGTDCRQADRSRKLVND